MEIMEILEKSWKFEIAQGPTPRSTNKHAILQKTNVTEERKKNMHIVFTRFPMADRWTSKCRSRGNQGHQ